MESIDRDFENRFRLSLGGLGRGLRAQRTRTQRPGQPCQRHRHHHSSLSREVVLPSSSSKSSSRAASGQDRHPRQAMNSAPSLAHLTSRERSQRSADEHTTMAADRPTLTDTDNIGVGVVGGCAETA
eukprot:3123146-Prymnesium_polylepis.1